MKRLLIIGLVAGFFAATSTPILASPTEVNKDEIVLVDDGFTVNTDVFILEEPVVYEIELTVDKVSSDITTDSVIAVKEAYVGDLDVFAPYKHLDRSIDSAVKNPVTKHTNDYLVIFDPGSNEVITNSNEEPEPEPNDEALLKQNVFIRPETVQIE